MPIAGPIAASGGGSGQVGVGASRVEQAPGARYGAPVAKDKKKDRVEKDAGKPAEAPPAQAPAGEEGVPPKAELPLSSAPLDLKALPADFLGAFFELAFPDKRLLELCRELQITTPGYRLEALPPDQVARVLA